MRFTGKIKNGKIFWHNNKALNEFLELNDNMECYIDIKASKARNTAQNNYYWAMLRDWGNDIGEDDVDYMHGLVKSRFKITTIKEFNKEEFNDFLIEVERYAAQNGWNGKPRSSTTLL